MKYKNYHMYIAFLLVVFLTGKNLFAQGGLYGRRQPPNTVNLIDQHNLGINIIDPVLPETLLHHGLKLDDIHRSAKEGIESAGWSQNQSSPYSIGIIISAKSLYSQNQLYTISAEWSTNNFSSEGASNGMGMDAAMSKTVLVSDTNYTLVLSAINELSRQAARKLQTKLFRELNLQPPPPRSEDNELSD